MCGIVGVASVQPVESFDWIRRALVSLRHRGPDGLGDWNSPDYRVAFGHVRLAILDLSSAGAQPMVDDHGHAITFNGEIYNYREVRAELAGLGVGFRTQTDTEVLLAAYRQWGTECLKRLYGMFAFAIYDSNSQVVFFARDRCGEKPLFYTLTSRDLKFCSELKGLFCDPAFNRKIHLKALDYYLAFGYTSSPDALIENVRKLPPAHFGVYNLKDGALSVQSYWIPPAFDEQWAKTTLTELSWELEKVLAAAIRSQLHADVPVGILLSGGLDSSIVVALAAQMLPRLNTFTVRMSGGGRYDEAPYAGQIANHFGTSHMVLDADLSSIDLLPLLARQFDEPIMDSSMIPTYLVARLVRMHCTVALGGDGGDELFGGYAHYPRLVKLFKAVSCFPPSLRQMAAELARHSLPLGRKGRNWACALHPRWDEAVPPIAYYFDQGGRDQLMPGVLPLSAEFTRIKQTGLGGGRLSRAMLADFKLYLPEDILVKVDRASMLSSLELRAPMLDYEMVQFAFKCVAPRHKATETGRKFVLRELAKKVLPQQFDSARKQGFSIPISDWLRTGPWRSLIRQVLFDRESIFNRNAIERLLRDHDSGLENGERLFGLLFCELWRREYKITI